MRFSKKLVAWLMTATMAAALVPTSALAAEPGEQTGTAAETRQLWMRLPVFQRIL